MKKVDFKAGHAVGGWCKMPTNVKTPVLKFGKIDVPNELDNRAYCTEIEDQGSLPWCAAYTAAAFAENVLWRRDGRIKQVEVEPIYKWAKKHDGDPNGDGTTLDCVLKALLEKGVFDKTQCKIRMVGRGLFSVDESDIKATIHRFGCFLAGFNITDEWYDLLGGCRKNVTGRRKGAKSLGGHAVLVCGFNSQGVWIENSWGKQWGERGFGLIEWEAFRAQFMYGTVLTNCLNGFK